MRMKHPNEKMEVQEEMCTLLVVDSVLTWWNSHVKTDGLEAAYEMSWKELMKMMTEKKIDRYIRGLPRNIQGNVTFVKPTRLQDAVRLANSLMDQKVRASASRQVEDKRRWESNQGNNHVQQPPPKRQNMARAYTAGYGEKKATPVPATTQRALVANQKAAVTWYECGKQGHYRSKYLRLKNQNYGNQVRNGEARGRAYTLGGGEANQDPNIITDTFLLNNRYDYILFYIGADRSFVLTTFSPLIDIIPTALDTKYTIELADGKLIGTNTIIRGLRIVSEFS
ncbi:hypothetical protein Tco_0623163 [Tanacetum coccineum]